MHRKHDVTREDFLYLKQKLGVVEDEEKDVGKEEIIVIEVKENQEEEEEQIKIEEEAEVESEKEFESGDNSEKEYETEDNSDKEGEESDNDQQIHISNEDEDTEEFENEKIREMNQILKIARKELMLKLNADFGITEDFVPDQNLIYAHFEKDPHLLTPYELDFLYDKKILQEILDTQPENFSEQQINYIYIREEFDKVVQTINSQDQSISKENQQDQTASMNLEESEYQFIKDKLLENIKKQKNLGKVISSSKNFQNPFKSLSSSKQFMSNRDVNRKVSLNQIYKTHVIEEENSQELETSNQYSNKNESNKRKVPSFGNNISQKELFDREVRENPYRVRSDEFIRNEENKESDLFKKMKSDSNLVNSTGLGVLLKNGEKIESKAIKNYNLSQRSGQESRRIHNLSMLSEAKPKNPFNVSEKKVASLKFGMEEFSKQEIETRKKNAYGSNPLKFQEEGKPETEQQQTMSRKQMVEEVYQGLGNFSFNQIEKLKQLHSDVVEDKSNNQSTGSFRGNYSFNPHLEANSSKVESKEFIEFLKKKVNNLQNKIKNIEKNHYEIDMLKSLKLESFILEKEINYHEGFLKKSQKIASKKHSFNFQRRKSAETNIKISKLGVHLSSLASSTTLKRSKIVSEKPTQNKRIKLENFDIRLMKRALDVGEANILNWQKAKEQIFSRSPSPSPLARPKVSQFKPYIHTKNQFSFST